MDMTLGQFATAVGAPKRWVQNAFQALGLPARYTEDLARRLAFARVVKETSGMPLRQAFPLAREALASWPQERVWRLEGPEGALRAEIDLERFLSSYAVRLSLARCWYAERRRGRPPGQRRRGIAWARWYGEDVSLLEESLKLTPEQRLRRLDQAVEDLKRFRLVRR
jgi:hypothetical protein